MRAILGKKLWILFLMFTGYTIVFSQEKPDAVKEWTVKMEEAISRDDQEAIIEILRIHPELTIPFQNSIFHLMQKNKKSSLRTHILKLVAAILKEENYHKSEDKKAYFESRLFSILGWDSSFLKNAVYSELDSVGDDSGILVDDWELITGLMEIIRLYHWEDSTYKIMPFIVFPLTEVRKAAYLTYAELKDDRIVSVLLEMLQSKNPLEKIYAIDALYYIHDERAVKILLQLLDDENKSVRFYAIRTLDEMKRSEAFTPFIRIMTDDNNPEIQVKAIDVLTKYKVQNAFYPMKKMVFDPHPDVRKAAIRGLYVFNNKIAAVDISRQIEFETLDELKIMEIQALLFYKSYGIGQTLKDLIKNEKNSSILIWTLYCVGETGYKAAEAEIWKRYPNLAPMEKAEALAALGKISDGNKVPFLVDILKDEKEPSMVRYAALWAVKKINSRSHVWALYNITDSVMSGLLLHNIKKTVVFQMKSHLN